MIGGFLMPFVVDVVLLLLVIAIIYRSVSKGFIVSFFDSCALIISGIVSYKLCAPVSESIYQNVIRGMIHSRFSGALENMSVSSVTSNRANELIKLLPQGAMRLAKAVGFNVNDAVQSLPKTMSDSQLITNLTDKIVHNIMIYVTEAFVFLIMLIVFFFIVKALSKFFDSAVKKMKLTDAANKALGGVFGVVKAVLMLVFLCTLLYVMRGSSSDPKVVSAIDASKIYSFVNAHNPIMKLF